MDFKFSDDQLKVSKSFSPLVPPTTTLEDGSLEITGFVQGVTWGGFKYKEDGTGAFFTFEKDGENIAKYIKEPTKQKHIEALIEAGDTDRAKELIGYTYSGILRDAKYFIKDEVVMSKAAELNETGITLQTLGEELFKLTQDKANLKNTDNVVLKIGFQKATGTEPKYTIPQKKYLGKTTDKGNYAVDWVDLGGTYGDIKNFAFVEATDTFAASAPLDLPFGDIDLN